MVKTEYKIGFIGSGLIAKKHLSVIKKNSKHIKIAGCFNPSFKDKNKKSLSCLKKTFGQLYSNLDEWLNSENPNIVYICTPPFARFSYEKELIKRGIHYFVEKPPLSSSQHKLSSLLRNNNQPIIKIGYQWRYLKFNSDLINLINNDNVGYVYAIRFSELPFQDWKINYKLSLGNTYEKLMHVVDYCEYIFGKTLNPINFINSKSEINKTIESSCTLPDVEVLTFKIGNSTGTISSINYSQGNDIFEITFVGRKNIYKIIAKDNGKINLEIIKSNKTTKRYSDLADELYIREFTDFIKSIKNKNHSSTTTYLKNLITSTKVLKIIKNGK